MSLKLEQMGFKPIKSIAGTHHVFINEFGNITFSSGLARELSIRAKHNAVLYFNEKENDYY